MEELATITIWIFRIVCIGAMIGGVVGIFRLFKKGKQ
jgi:hypothetical protein